MIGWMMTWIMAYIVASGVTGIIVLGLYLWVMRPSNIVSYANACKNCGYKTTMATVWHCSKCERVEFGSKVLPVKKMVSEEL